MTITKYKMVMLHDNLCYHQLAPHRKCDTNCVSR
jgi:hypothetical protein